MWHGTIYLEGRQLILLNKYYILKGIWGCTEKCPISWRYNSDIRTKNMNTVETVSVIHLGSWR